MGIFAGSTASQVHIKKTNVSKSGGVGIYLSSPDSIVNECTVNENRIGLAIHGGTYTVANLKANRNRFGVSVTLAPDSVLENIVANGNTEYGVKLGASSHRAVLRNVKTNHNGIVGVQLYSSNGVSLENIVTMENTYTGYLPRKCCWYKD